MPADPSGQDRRSRKKRVEKSRRDSSRQDGGGSSERCLFYRPWLGDDAGWACLALPLRDADGGILGYFALFVAPHALGPHTHPYVRTLALMLESEINAGRPSWADFTDYMGEQLEQFDLTPRERQVAALWMMDYDYKQIGRAIGISENTVRVIVSRLNAKLDVNSKASLILRVLGAI